MFIDVMHSSVLAEQHRGELLADAEQHRLATIARSAQRAARRATDLALQQLVEQRTGSRTAGEPAGTSPPGPRIHR
jgi:hypothetical protein